MSYTLPSLYDPLSPSQLSDVQSGSPTLDVGPTIQTFLSGLGSMAGKVIVPNNFKAYIGTSFTIPNYVTLEGPHANRGIIGNGNCSDINAMGGQFCLGSGVSISVGGGAALTGCVVTPQGMTFPQNNSTAWAGTAIKTAGDDACVENCLIVGFGEAILSSGFQRPRIGFNKIDCNTGVELTGCADVARIYHNHCWPFGTVSVPGAAANYRNGAAAYYVHDTADWTIMDSNFSYGYFRGHYLSNVGNVYVKSGMADGFGASNPANICGLVLTGAVGECNIQFRTNGQYDGAYISCSSLTWNYIEMMVGNALNNGMLFDSGNAGAFSVRSRITGTGGAAIQNSGSGALSLTAL